MSSRARFTLFFVLCFASSFAQTTTYTLGGVVKDNEGQLLIGASVGIQSLNKFILTDSEGRFELVGIAPGNHKIVTRFIGYEELTITLNVTGDQKNLMLVMTTTVSELEAVTVMGKSETQLAIEQPIKSLVIDTKDLARQPSTMIELINRSPGVRVRQTGGLGSNASIIVNGFQGRAIRYFKDGIPMDYLGAGYSFSLVPVEQLERLEVYKGVLPVSLGGDALGGAINMVTQKPSHKMMNVSYEVASFNTHRASVNLYYPDTTNHVFVGADLFVNHSDNDYTVTPEHLGKEVKLFHNQFTHYYGEVYGGVMNKRWADELRIGLTGFWIERENQYGARMTTAFGAYVSHQHSIVPTLRYKKRLLNDRLVVDHFMAANTITVTQADTAKGEYDWYGNYTPSETWRGEASIDGSASEIDFSYVTSRTYVSYDLSSTQKIEFNFVYSDNKRVGKDPFGLTFKVSGRDILSVPANYNKIVVAAGLESHLFNERITNNFIVKYFGFNVDALDAAWDGAEQPRYMESSKWGIADAVKFSFGDNSFVRMSGELATRLPEQDEIFGNGNLHVSNFELVPEKSVNANIGFFTVSKNDKLKLEVNAFYRRTKDLIINVPYNFLFNRYENVNNVRGIGFETDIVYSLWPWLRANGNFTYQDFRLFDTGNTLHEGARLRNTPYFFANLGLSSSARGLIKDTDKIDLYWFFSFVREYYLENIPKQFEPDGFLGLWGRAKFDANIIPDQTIHTAGITYYPFNDKLSIGMQVKNVFDAKVYDSFKIQNAGRSLHFKVSYTLTNKVQ